jgi:hypothetical protein
MSRIESVPHRLKMERGVMDGVYPGIKRTQLWVGICDNIPEIREVPMMSSINS